MGRHRDPSLEEIRRAAAAHRAALFAELRMASDEARERYSPLNIVRRHPVASAAAAGLGGLLLARAWAGRRARRAGGDGAGGKHPLRRALLTSVLGALVPALVRAGLEYLNRRRSAARRARCDDAAT